MMIQTVNPKRRVPDERFRFAKRALPFVESGAGKYTHRVRFVQIGTVNPDQWKPHMAVGCWCGMGINIGTRKGRPFGNGSRLVAEPTRVLCATCEGRAIGAGQLGAQMIAGRPVMYRPMTSTQK